MEWKGFQFTIADSNIDDAKSLMLELEDKEYLKSRYNGHERAQGKSANKERENMRKAEKYFC